MKRKRRCGEDAPRVRCDEEQRERRTSIITWNVDGLRALFRSQKGMDALRELLLPRPLILCLLEHKLQGSTGHRVSIEAKDALEHLADEHGYSVTWTFSPRAGFDGLVSLVRLPSPDWALPSALCCSRPPFEPTVTSSAVARERRLLCIELEALHVVLAYAPNSGRPGRLEYRTDVWEPTVRALLCALQADGRPLLYQGDLNVAHVRELDAWGTTDAQFGRFKESGRTREEQSAFDRLLDECDLSDGFRHYHPAERSATCWAQKRQGHPAQREHWKRYDYALASHELLDGSGGAVRLVDVRHLHDAFEGGRPDHVPVEAVLEATHT